MPAAGRPSSVWFPKRRTCSNWRKLSKPPPERLVSKRPLPHDSSGEGRCFSGGSMKNKLALVILLSLCAASGCGPGRVYIQAHEGFQKQMDADKGTLTFEQAVGRWGK